MISVLYLTSDTVTSLGVDTNAFNVALTQVTCRFFPRSLYLEVGYK